MGEFAIGWRLRGIAWAGAAAVMALNLMLLLDAFGLPFAGFRT
jgi:Mn2+/Fe2+ NRAMP family transporter